MEPTSKKAADDVIKHREDGEEAMKRTSNVVSIESGKRNQSVQPTADSNPKPEED